MPIVIAYGGLLVFQLWHYPSDVMAGWCIALAWVTGVWLALRRAASRRLRFRSRTDPLDSGSDCAQSS
jgi:undecaprenyl-diphosphatase